MKARFRAVVDTNVIISYALFRSSVPRRAIQEIMLRGVLVLSDPIAAETRRIIAKPKFDRILPLRDREAEIDTILAAAETVGGLPAVRASRDPDDDIVLATAIAGRADVIISGDRDLLVLSPFEGIQVLTPAAFLTWVETECA